MSRKRPIAFTTPFITRLQHSPHPPTHCKSKLPIRLTLPLPPTLLATTLSLLLSTQTLTELQHPPPQPPATPSTLSPADKKALKAQSVKNTRSSGRISQQFALARRQQAANELDAALDSYDAIIREAASFAPAYSNRANIYAARKEYGLALADYDVALNLAPLDGDAWIVYVNRGVTKLAMGDVDDALVDLNVADELRSNDEIVLSNRAMVYEKLHKWDSALRDYQRALKASEVRPFWNRYGLVLFQRNKPTEAVAILKRVAGRFDVSDVHAALAVVYFDRGDVAAAETEWSSVERPRLFESRKFLEEERNWPPRAVDAMDRFRTLKE